MARRLLGPNGLVFQDGTAQATALTVASVTTTTTAITGRIYLASGTFTVTIPVVANTQVQVKNTGAGVITVVPASGQIDGAANFVLPVLGAIHVVSDGTNAWIL